MPTATRRDRIPAFRHWFANGAFFGAMATGWNVLVAIIGIAPITTTGVKWWLFAIGALLSLAMWYAMAASNASNEQGAKEAKDRHEREMGATEELRKTVEGLEDQLQQAAVESRKMQVDVAAIRTLMTGGMPTDAPQVARLAESVAASAATIQSIVLRPDPVVVRFSVPNVTLTTTPPAPKPPHDS